MMMKTLVLPKGVLTRRVCLVLAALLGLGIVGCEVDPQDESIVQQIEGEWALVRITGGIAGVDETYSPTTSPETVRFDDEGEYTYIRRPQGFTSRPPDTTTGRWFMTEGARRGDTLSFRFTDQLPFQLSSARVQLIARETLQTRAECCDQLNYTYVKR